MTKAELLLLHSFLKANMASVKGAATDAVPGKMQSEVIRTAYLVGFDEGVEIVLKIIKEAAEFLP